MLISMLGFRFEGAESMALIDDHSGYGDAPASNTTPMNKTISPLGGAS
jgi:hypothetical protein